MWVLGARRAPARALWPHWAWRRWLGAFFAYNANFAWGFFNYYFAAGPDPGGIRGLGRHGAT